MSVRSGETHYKCPGLDRDRGRARPQDRAADVLWEAVAGLKTAACEDRRMDLRTAAWPDAEAVDTDLALVPVGSTEQHGPHAPLATDTIAAEAVAVAGADRYDGAVVVAPAIPVGVS